MYVGYRKYYFLDTVGTKKIVFIVKFLLNALFTDHM